VTRHEPVYARLPCRLPAAPGVGLPFLFHVGHATRLLGIFLASVAFALVGVVAAWHLAIHAIHGLALKHLTLNPGMRVVDIGCGPGRLTVRIAKEVGPTGDVVAMDVDPRALREAEKRAIAAGQKNIHFILAGAGEGKLGQSRFDRAVLVAVLGEITNRSAAMAEILGALKPGGLLSITEVALDPHRRSAGEVRRLAKATGFVVEACFGNRLLFTLNLIKPPQPSPNPADG
jgi:cyclopropane fatty-acyl-phospholipid synthase-like methyltransferase